MPRRLLVVVLLSACHRQVAQVATWPADCPPHAPANVRPISVDSVAQLAGRWDLVVVSLSHGPARKFWRGELRLVESDPETRVRRGAFHVVNGVLIGSWQLTDAPGYQAIDADVKGTTLSLDCVRNCIDGPRSDLRLLAIAGDRLWGVWEDPQEGISIVVDSAGHPLPNPAGYFCAKRSA